MGGAFEPPRRLSALAYGSPIGLRCDAMIENQKPPNAVTRIRERHVPAAVVAGLGATLLFTACAAPQPCTRDHGAAIRGDTSRRQIALIFTGGEYGEGTEFILNALRDAAIQAGFFVTGDYVAHVDHHARLRRMVLEGHYVGPHSHTHPLYCPWEDRERTLVTREFFTCDLARNIAELREFGALQPNQPVYFIPPYEWYNADQVEWAAQMGVTLFNFSPGSGSNRDWIPEGHARFVSSGQILRDILAYEQQDPRGLNGFFLLLHLGSRRVDKMHVHLPALIDALRDRGYTFARVDTLLAACDQK